VLGTGLGDGADQVALDIVIDVGDDALIGLERRLDGAETSNREIGGLFDQSAGEGKPFIR